MKSSELIAMWTICSSVFWGVQNSIHSTKKTCLRRKREVNKLFEFPRILETFKISGINSTDPTTIIMHVTKLHIVSILYFVSAGCWGVWSWLVILEHSWVVCFIQEKIQLIFHYPVVNTIFMVVVVRKEIVFLLVPCRMFLSNTFWIYVIRRQFMMAFCFHQLTKNIVSEATKHVSLLQFLCSLVSVSHQWRM